MWVKESRIDDDGILDVLSLESRSNVKKGSQIMGLQLLQLELRLGKIPSRSFRSLKSAENFCQIPELCSVRVSFSLDRSWSKCEPSLWLSWLVLS
ncbi:hypothetical protein Tco_1384146 [Tanacetum coccineum]